MRPLRMGEWMAMADRMFKDRDNNDTCPDFRSLSSSRKAEVGVKVFRSDPFFGTAMLVLEAVDEALRKGVDSALRSMPRGACVRTEQVRRADAAQVTLTNGNQIANDNSTPSSSSSSSSSSSTFATSPSNSSLSASFPSAQLLPRRRRLSLPLRCDWLRSLAPPTGGELVPAVDLNNDPASWDLKRAAAVAPAISSSSCTVRVSLSSEMMRVESTHRDPNAQFCPSPGRGPRSAAAAGALRQPEEEKMGEEGFVAVSAAPAMACSMDVVRHSRRRRRKKGPAGSVIVNVAYGSRTTSKEGGSNAQLRSASPDPGPAVLQPPVVYTWADCREADKCMSSYPSPSPSPSPSSSTSLSCSSLSGLWRMEGGGASPRLAMADATMGSRTAAAAGAKREEDDEVGVLREIGRKRWWCNGSSMQWQQQVHEECSKKTTKKKKRRRKKGWWCEVRTENGDLESAVKRGVCDLLQSLGESRRDVLRWLRSIPKSEWGFQTIVTAQHFLAGAMSAAVSRTALAPLERVKLEYLVRGSTAGLGATIQQILGNEGPLGFWKGNLVNVLRTAPFKSINFYAFDWARKFLVDLKEGKEGVGGDLNNLERLAAGAFAGVAATLLCFPMDTIRTRLVAKGGENLGGIGGCFDTIVRNEGAAALYRGLLPGLMSIAPAGAVFYGVCDLLKSSYLKSEAGKARMEARMQRQRGEEEEEEDDDEEEEERRGRKAAEGRVGRRRGARLEGMRAAGQMELGAMRTLLYGAIAGACAETATYPLEVLRRQLQLQGAQGVRLGIRRTLAMVISEGGLPALYAGWLPSTLQVLPSAALSYYVYEFMKALMRIP